jgi:hypothetical protein
MDWDFTNPWRNPLSERRPPSHTSGQRSPLHPAAADRNPTAATRLHSHPTHVRHTPYHTTGDGNTRRLHTPEEDVPERPSLHGHSDQRVGGLNHRQQSNEDDDARSSRGSSGRLHGRPVRHRHATSPGHFPAHRGQVQRISRTGMLGQVQRSRNGMHHQIRPASMERCVPRR